MSSLPAEICNTIFNYLERKDIFEFLFVCKNWYSGAYRSYWKKMTIYAKRISHIEAILHKSDRKQYFKHGLLTRILVFEPHYDEKEVDNRKEFNQDTIVQLLQYFPRIEMLGMPDHFYFNYASFLLRVQWKYLKNIAPPSDSVAYSLYTAVCSYLRQTITSFTCRTSQFSPAIRDGCMFKMFFCLSAFINLTDLTFCNDINSNMTFVQVLEACPNVTSLHFENSYQVPDNIIQNMGYLPTHINRNLKNLRLTLVDFPVTYVRYLIKYLPDHFEEIYLKATKLNLYKWVDEVQEDNALRFMKRLNRVKIAEVLFVDSKNRARLFLPIYDPRITLYFRLLNYLKGSKETYCTFSTNCQYSSHN